MKKIFIAVFTLMSISTFALNLNLGVNMNQGSFDIENGAEYDFDGTNYGFQAELTQGFIIGDLGAGISYEPGYKLDGSTGEFNAMPMYLIGRVNLFPIAIKPYFAVKVGKTMYSGDKGFGSLALDNGEFYAASFGVTLINMLQAEAMYSIRTGTLGNTDVTSSVVSLSLSYNLF